MTDQDKTPNPPDHATARIITELAAVLTAPLKEAVSSGLSKTLESLPADIDREVEETLSSLRRLKALAEDMANTLTSARQSISELSGGMLPLSRACETINEAAARLAQLPSERQNDAGKINQFLRSLETGFSDWNGVLKANGRAQTHELSEFSAEVAEQVGWMKSAMPGIVEKIVEKALSSRAEEWVKISQENTRAFETRLTKFEKTVRMLLILWGSFLILLGVLYFK